MLRCDFELTKLRIEENRGLVLLRAGRTRISFLKFFVKETIFFVIFQCSCGLWLQFPFRANVSVLLDSGPKVTFEFYFIWSVYSGLLAFFLTSITFNCADWTQLLHFNIQVGGLKSCPLTLRLLTCMRRLFFWDSAFLGLFGWTFEFNFFVFQLKSLSHMLLYYFNFGRVYILLRLYFSMSRVVFQNDITACLDIFVKIPSLFA